MITYIHWLEKIGYSKEEIKNMDKNTFDILTWEFTNLVKYHKHDTEVFK